MGGILGGIWEFAGEVKNVGGGILGSLLLIAGEFWGGILGLELVGKVENFIVIASRQSRRGNLSNGYVALVIASVARKRKRGNPNFKVKP